MCWKGRILSLSGNDGLSFIWFERFRLPENVNNAIDWPFTQYYRKAIQHRNYLRFGWTKHPIYAFMEELIFELNENTVVELVHRRSEGIKIKDLRNIREASSSCIGNQSQRSFISPTSSWQQLWETPVSCINTPHIMRVAESTSVLSIAKIWRSKALPSEALPQHKSLTSVQLENPISLTLIITWDNMMTRLCKNNPKLIKPSTRFTCTQLVNSDKIYSSIRWDKVQGVGGREADVYLFTVQPKNEMWIIWVYREFQKCG